MPEGLINFAALNFVFITYYQNIMKQTIKRVLLSLAAMLFVVSAYAQVTTSSLTGKVSAKNGESVPGATVVAVHTPSGTQYYAVANEEGQFFINGMRSGGPYTVEVSCLGYHSVTYSDITLALADVFNLSPVLADDNEVLSEAIVISEMTSKFSSEKTGAATNISNRQLTSMPTVSRSISDIAKLSPYANGMSFAGGDGRSSNFTVDGANFNNNFGLSENLPGGGNPISLDAIDEIQVVVAPFDVRQTNFIGGGVNAVTKSGTNTFKGTVYGYHNNQDLRGNRIAGRDLGDRAAESNTTWGVTLGGPIVKNKLFFFVNYEQTKTPGQVIKYRANKGGEPNQGNVSRTLASDMQRVMEFCKTKYDYNTGSYTDFPADQSNRKILARIDWNINDANHLAVRYNHTKNTAWREPNGNSTDAYRLKLDSNNRVSNNSMAFANNMYSDGNTVNSITADLNSKFSEKVSNQFLFTYTSIDDVRGSNSSPFPHVDIQPENAEPGENYMSLGYELFTWNNGVHNKIYTVKDDITILAGRHKILAGVNFEHQFANNAYMRNGTMYYRYRSVEDFLTCADPESFIITYGWNGEANPTAQVTFNQIGLYGQDEWQVNDKFKLTYGVRLDELVFDNKDIATNKAILAYTYRGGEKLDTGKWPNANLQVSPRVGFVWDVYGDRSFKVRGGTGLFAGRLPLVFFTNMPTNAGLVQNTVNWSSTYKDGVETRNPNIAGKFNNGMITDVATAIDKLGLQKEISDEYHVATEKQSGVDPNFKMPQVWKTSLAFDWQVPVDFPFTVTAEGMFNKTINGVFIDNINIKDPSSFPRFAGADNRYKYPSDAYINKLGSKNINAVMLRNTNKGYGYTANVTVNMTPVKYFDIMVAYTHTESKEISGMPGSDPVSAWQGLYTVDGPNFGTVQRSRYVIPDRIIASVGYFIPWRAFGEGKGLHLNLFYQAYSPYGYSYAYTNDMNGDGITGDLMYIPKDDSEINFKSQEDHDLYWAFAKQDKYLSSHKGQYAEAYAARAPFVHKLDLKVVEDFAFRIGKTSHNFQVSLDLLNLGNLLNSNWGVNMNNSICNGSAVLKYEGVNANNQPVFSFFKDKQGVAPNKTFDYYVNNTQCWQIQLGIKYLFN